MSINPPPTEYGDLRVTLTSAFEFGWNTKGTGAARQGAFWHPVPQVKPSGAGPVTEFPEFRPIGSIVVGHESDIALGKRGALLIADNPGPRKARTPTNPPAVAAPEDYTLVARTSDTGEFKNRSLWRPVPPSGYVAMGDVIHSPANPQDSQQSKPSRDKVWCVRQDLVKQGAYVADVPVWASTNSGAQGNASFWEVSVKPNDFAGVIGFEPVPCASPATFMTNSQATNMRPDRQANVLKLDISPRFYEMGDDMSTPPAITNKAIPTVGTLMEPSQTLSIRLPYTCFYPDANPYGSLMNPFVLLNKYVQWRAVANKKNTETNVFNQRLEIAKGVDPADPAVAAFKSVTGVSLSSDRGVQLAQSGIDLNTQVRTSRQQGGSSSGWTFLELVQKDPKSPNWNGGYDDFVVQPRSAAVVWARRVRFEVWDLGKLQQSPIAEFSYLIHDGLRVTAASL